uniref:Vitellogenin domain-containing protein n=1 Tax=Panagrellus redivivus TaxID=6233 RepID=A0A7E4VJH3_PANRE
MKLLALTLCAFVAISAAASRHRPLPPSEVTPFAAGYEYTFRYTTQIASSIQAQQNNNEQPDAQQSTYQVSALAAIHFQTERIATLTLKDITVTAQNGAIIDPRRVASISLGEEKTLEAEIQAQLEYVCKFDYVNGLVEKIYFHGKDNTWSKNIKRAILNMVQLNLARRNTAVQGFNYADDSTKPEQSKNMFTLPEISLEGECQTMYTFNAPFNGQSFNVTKSIDFKQCNRIAKTQYGPRAQKPCAECKQRVIDEQQLDRASVLQFELVGTPEKYAIRRVQLLSQYVYKTLAAEAAHPMQTVVAAELILTNVEKKTVKALSAALNTKEESLLYSAEWDQLEKRFYQYGDIEFTRETTPFAKVNNKIQTIVSLLKHISAASADKTNGIETETPLRVQKLVELVRMCTVAEMKQVREQIESLESQTEQLKLQEIWANTLGIAGTRNAVDQIVHGILNKDIPTQKAVEALKQLTGVIAPSDSIVDSLLHLCKSEVAQRNAPVRQACWLTAGAMIGDLCQETGYLAQTEQQCPRPKKEQYVKTLVQQYTSAETTYQKVLALKTIGNAALDLSVYDLEKIIVNPAEEPLIRQQAIDALRRLRNQMPRKIQSILMPVFKNMREAPEVRMTAFTMILYTNPENAVADQLAYVLFHERSQHVKSFVYSALQVFAQSPVPVEQRLAKHLQSVLKMTAGAKDSGCNFGRVPIYSEAQGEGIFVNWASVFSTNNMLPKHLGLSLDSALNGLLEKNAFSISLSQKDIEQYYQQLIDAIYSQTSSSSRARRASMNKNGEEELDYIFDNLDIQTRDAMDRNAFGMLAIRVRDIDTVIVPIADEFLPADLLKALRGERVSYSNLDWKLFEGKHFRSSAVASLHERSTKIATSSGLPLQVLHSIPTAVSIDGQIKTSFENGQVKLNAKAQPMFTAVHLISMQIWSPIVATGVESMHTLNLNLPLNADVHVGMGAENEKFKLKLRLPEQKTRLVSVHSLPVTFVRDFNTKTMMLGEPKVKAIRNQMLEPRLVDMTSSQRTAQKTGLRVSGHLHQPNAWTYRDILAVTTTSENHVVVDFEPTRQAPKEIELTIFSKLFSRSSESSAAPSLKSFFAKNSQHFDSIYESEDESETFADRQTALNSFLDSDYKPRQTYKHSFKAVLKTKGAENDIKAEIEVTPVCDSNANMCQIEATAQRSALFADETSTWNMKSKTQVLMPQYVRKLSQLKDNRQNKLIVNVEAEWGNSDAERQKLNLQLNGERAAQKNMPTRRLLASAFLNRYNLAADYRLSPAAETRFAQYFELFKLYNFWSVESRQKTNKDNAIFATLVIDPRTRQYANLTIATPEQRVRLSNFRLWTPVKPFNLVRAQTNEINSVSDVIDRVSEENRAECRVDGYKVKSFDGVFFKAPITKCYTVIAKDCARKSFAVVMKALNEDSDKKQIKIATKKAVIQIEPRRNSEKLVVRINGEEVSDEQTLSENWVTINNAESNARINLPQGVLINFDGEEASVKLSGMYKNAQCGLCGHYDGEANDEWRKNDNTVTDDLKAFHRSYSLLEDDSECEQKYNQDSSFSTLENDSESEYDSAYDSEDDREDNREYNHFDADSDESDSNESDDDSNRASPISKTQVVEYNHKICFSAKPVKQCPRGSYAVESEQMKVPFACMKRSSSEARRLLRAARSEDISSKLSDNKPSFVESVKVALACERF